MIIIDNISGKITVKLPNNLVKSSKPILHLKNTEIKKDLCGLDRVVLGQKSLQEEQNV